jgi:hypothetical protein
MDIALQKYYEDRIVMCGSDAWKELMKDIEGMLKATDTLSSVTENHSLDFRKGEVSMMRWMLSIGSISEQAYEGLKNEVDE